MKQIFQELSMAVAKQIKVKFAEYTSEIKELDPSKNGTFKMIITTSDVDRHGEVVKAEGMEYSNYLNNPIVLFGHDYWNIESVVGKTTKLYKEGEQRVAEGVFAGTETAQTVRQLYDEGIINTASVGFITLQRNEQDRDIIEKWELLEWSFVSIPANPEAHRKNAALVKKAIEMGIITKMQKVEEKSETIDEVLDNEDSSEESNEKKIENIETELKEIKKILKTLADGNAKAKDFEAKEVLQQVDRIVGEALRSFKSK